MMGATRASLKPDAVIAATSIDVRAAVGGEIAPLVQERAEVADRLEVVAPLEEVRAGGVVHARSAEGPQADRDDAFAFRQGQRGVEPRAQDGEVARADRDRHRHAGHRHERQAGIFDEHPQPELHVEPGDAPERAPRFGGAVRGEHRGAGVAHAGRVAEPLRRRFPRGLGAHAAIDVVARPLLQVKPQLLVHFLCGIRADDPVPRAPRRPPFIAVPAPPATRWPSQRG